MSRDRRVCMAPTCTNKSDGKAKNWVLKKVDDCRKASYYGIKHPLPCFRLPENGFSSNTMDSPVFRAVGNPTCGRLTPSGEDSCGTCHEPDWKTLYNLYNPTWFVWFHVELGTTASEPDGFHSSVPRVRAARWLIYQGASPDVHDANGS